MIHRPDHNESEDDINVWYIFSFDFKVTVL